ncbi:5,10-methylenetetrahydromethanopterin reductase [Streptosporangium violaceochromogenes]|nr:5,10-methylenetetrahydromethanopterin reductase [Streptosporangium violaceochromogenes]
MTSRRGLEFGLSIWLDNAVREVAPLARFAEQAGFTDLWVPDHYFLRDSYVAQALMALETERIRFGTAVAAAQLRHPALLASSTATVDELSGGRAILGIGPGGHEFAAQFDMRPKSPLTLVREAVAVARGLFRGGSDLEGTIFTTRGARLGWPTGDIPVYLAARGTKMLELAGEVADGVLIHGITVPYVRHVKELVARGAERAGRSPDDCEIAVILDAEVNPDEAAAIDAMRDRVKVMAGGKYSDDLIPLYELDPGDVAALRAALNEGRPDAHRFVTDAMVRAFALAGGHSTLVRRCRELHDAGIDRIIVFSNGTVDHTRSQIDGFAPIIKEVTQ